MTWPDLLQRPRPSPDRTISYGSDPLQVVDLWLPADAGPHRTVLMVHGGCWQTAIAERDIMNWIADDLRRRGYAVWNVEYRGVDRLEPPYQGMFDDVAAAADALREHGPSHRLDLARVVTIGHSAGGHLALWLAARPRLSPPPANPLAIHHAISLGGLQDLEQALREDQGCGREVVEKVLAGGARQRSLPRLAPIGVPQSLINGASDRIIPINFAADYRRTMQAAGDTIESVVIPGQGHVELIAPETPAWARAVVAIEQAFGR
ncbi:MAG: alpha/beta hydrolase family protein [Sphingosinicella sp.]